MLFGKMTIRATLIATLCASSMVAHAIADTAKSVNVQAGELATAIESLARQCGIYVVYPSEQLKGFMTKGVAGTLETKEAFRKLLEGTPLILRQEGSAVLISLPRADTKSSAGPQQQKPVEVEEVVVTGTNIRGTGSDLAPVTVLDRSYIDSTGYGTTSRLLQSLPQNFASTNQSGVLVPGVTGNTEQGSGINLRGIGEGTTLVLLNGRRLAPGFLGSGVDISALPLSAIDRVEVLGDGASAIYGSDAVGGVVNFILRRDFNGSETSLRAGEADGGLNEYRFSQASGGSWGSGNALASFEYYRRDLLSASDREFVPSSSVIGSLLPRDKNYSGLFSGRQNLSDSVAAFFEGLYTHRDSFNRGGYTFRNPRNSTTNAQLSATTGLSWQATADWKVELSGTYARNTLDQTQRTSDVEAFLGAYLVDTRFTLWSGDLKADGPVFAMPAGDARAAMGIGRRAERLRDFEVYSSGVLPPLVRDTDQVVSSAFVELHVPLYGDANSRAGLQRLDISVAGRFDRYSEFGSSTNPKVSLLWSPASAVNLRASYGTSYVAPKLTDYSLSVNQAVAYTDLDPSSAGGFSRQLQLLGTDAGSLKPQKAKNFFAGVEFQPQSLPGLHVSADYFSIRYRDQIANPPIPSVVLANPASFGSLFLRNPSIADVQRYIAAGSGGQGFVAYNPDFTLDENFDPASIEVIVDQRRRNLSEVETNGFDTSIAYTLGAGAQSLRLGVDGTYLLSRKQRITRTSQPFETIDTFYNPPDLRLRGSASWARGGLSTNVFVNYTASYEDNRRQVISAVGSYTTVDARVAYDFSERRPRSVLSGLTLSLDAQNLFDQDPPHTIIIDLKDMGFDPTNASPLGRLLSVQVVKAW